MIGETISHYRITGRLGHGGMGIVYQAEDTKLDRTAAIKVLPPAALVSEDDRARFYREAKAAAQLSHPNIAAIYEIDEVPLSSDGGIPTSGGTSSGMAGSMRESRPFIAMEYIAGGTLGDVIARGPLKLKDAVRIASEVAAALKAAHAKDIVHRDVKPSNVMLDADGRAKVLDFGLAKTTRSTLLTQVGSTLGTIAYMSPEQARGENVDSRSDLWSLGILLYEMVAGRLPYRGDYEQAVVYSILNEDPEPLTAVRSGVPMELERIVNKLLSKNEGRRYQTAADLIADLDSVDLGGTGAFTTMRSTPSASAAVAPRMTSWIPYAIGVAALGIGVLIGLTVKRETPEPELPMHVSVNVSGEPNLSHPTISPDGRYISYTASGSKLQLYDMTDGSIRTIVENSNVRINRFSPDGQWLVFEQDAQGLSIVRVPDGTPARLNSAGQTPTWIDNEWVLYVNGLDVEKMSRITQQSELLWKSPGDASMALEHPEVLPGGTHALVSTIQEGERSLGLLELETGDIRSLHSNGIAGRYVSSGHIIFTEQAAQTTSYRGRIFAQPFDLKTMSTRGPAILVLSERGYWELGINARGDLVTAGGIANSLVQRPMSLSRLNPESGTLTRILSPMSTTSGFSLSRDGEWLVYVDGTDGTLHITAVNGDRTSPMPQSMSPAIAPFFSDNDDLVYYSSGTPTRGVKVYRQLSDGSRPPERLEMGRGNFEILRGLDAEGRLALVAIASAVDDSARLEIIDVSTMEEILTVEDVWVENADISPDGKWVAYSAEYGAGGRVYVTGIDGSGPWLIGSEMGRPIWSKDGTEMYVRDAVTIMALPISTSRGVRVSGPERVLYTGSSAMDYGYDRPTGDLLIVDRIDVASETVDRLDLVLNWDERLKETVPAQ